jgi:hypothetical protein
MLRTPARLYLFSVFLAILAHVMIIPSVGIAADDSTPSVGPVPDSSSAPPAMSAARLQELELAGQPETKSEDKAQIYPDTAGQPVTPLAAVPSLKPHFINFGYIQSESILPHVRWNALTHVGTLFVDFEADGSLESTLPFTNRDARLKAGGAAQAAGTKVILVVRNDDFDAATLTTVMTSPSLRTTLVNNIVNLITADSYCHGVNFDFEFSWGASTRDGITAFLQEMRTALPSSYEMSVYTHAIYNSTYWNIAAIEPYIDYLLYSTYDWATGNTARAIGDFNNCVPELHNYFNAGLPPEKCVLVWPSYSRRWQGITTYGATGSSPVSQGFTDGLYDTTLRTDWGGPWVTNYVTGDEVEWYTYNNGTTNFTATWDSVRSLEHKIRAALSCPASGSSAFNGRRLGGVGWWSLMWMAETSSYNPISGTTISRTRTYPHIYQLCEEILSPPGDKTFLFEGFEGNDPRWRDPNESPDTAGDTDNDSVNTLVVAPSGTGRPASTNNAMRLTFDFENPSGNRLFFRHEVLHSDINPPVTDVHSCVVRVDANTRFICPIHVAGNYSPRTIRMALLDGNRQIEVSPPVTLNTTGWQTLTWDINDPSQIIAYDTNEPAFIDGNGVLNTAGNGARDIGFLGFIIEGGGAGSGQITFDELSYSPRNPGGVNYVINEFRYAVNSSEFVEIHGPPGAFPSGTELRFYSASTGDVLSSVSLTGQVIPASGLFVVGDSGVPGVNLVPTGWGAADNIPDVNPSAMQIYNTSNGNVYDSVVYEAMGGLGNLTRPACRNVTGEGWGWLGEIGPGTTNSGVPYTKGRYPDGNDTNVNGNDFSVMPATPGAPNGGSITGNVTYNFNTAPANAFTTYQSFTVGASGVGASPSGGNVHRCVDTSGGGQISVFGDAALGSLPGGYTVTGEIYIPSSSHPVQAIGIGICGRQGSVFFANTPDAFGYESGYWLIYENAAGAGLNDGRPDHPGVFEFLHVSNDRMDSAPVTLLSSVTRTATGAPNGGWTTFMLTIDPGRAAGDRLIARINNTDVFRGNIPAGGPTSGAFMVGFRENHTGPPASNEGTWVDNIQISIPGFPVSVSRFEID